MKGGSYGPSRFAELSDAHTSGRFRDQKCGHVSKRFGCGGDYRGACFCRLDFIRTGELPGEQRGIHAHKSCRTVRRTRDTEEKGRVDRSDWTRAEKRVVPSAPEGYRSCVDQQW